MKTGIVFLSCLCAIALTACLGSGGGGGGTGASSTANPSALSAPTGVNAAAGDGQVTVSWSPVPGATSYSTYIGTDHHVSTGNYTRKVSSDISPAIISGLLNGKAYWLMVTATDATSESMASSRVKFIPSRGVVSLGPVTGLSAVPGKNSVTLHWNATANAAGYWIQYGTDPNFAPGVQTRDMTVASAITSTTVTWLANGTTYFFRIRATNGSLTGILSDAVSAIPIYMTGWNGMTLIGDLWWRDTFDYYYGAVSGPSASRTANLNSNRDALCAWQYAGSVYVSTYTKATDWVRSGLAYATELSYWPKPITNLAPSSSLSDNGDGAVAWVERVYLSDRTTYHDDVVVRHYQGGVWGAPIPLSGAESGSYATSPEIKLDKDGNGVAAWHGNDGNFYARTYDRMTSTWSATATISTGINPAVDGVRIGVDGTGGFALAWSEKTATSTGVNGVFLRRYSKAAGWGAAERINLDDPALDAFNGIQSLSVNANGDIFVLWEHSPAAGDHRLMLRRYAAATATWNNPVTVDTSNGSLSRGKVKSNSATNAVISWFKTVSNAGATVDSHNFAVYREAAGGVGPVEQMLLADHAINTVDIVTDAANSFRMLYALSSATRPAIAYERDYDIVTQAWSTPVVIDRTFGKDDFIATANAVGEMMLTSSEYFRDRLGYDWAKIRAKFYLP